MGLKTVPIDALPKLQASGEPTPGSLFAIEHWDFAKIEGNWISYEEFRLMRPLVLAVSGLLHCGELFLFGKRGSKVTQFPGFWELAPSGSVAEADLQRAFQRELFEETGLKGEGIPYGLCLDDEERVLDLLFHLNLETASLPAPNEEYEEFRWLSKKAANRLKLVPVSKSILNNFPLD